jgi:DNA-binding LytR/AlgR family response regulator
MRILILEDEIPAYEKLIGLLSEYFQESFENDWSRFVEEAKVLLANNEYDLILSDIRLKDGLSFDAFKNIQLNCPIIFCTAHDEYLLDAFKTNGIGYILKPYTKEDLHNSLEKYHFLVKTNQPLLDSNTIERVKDALKQRPYKNRFIIKYNNKIKLLNVSDVSLFNAEKDFSIALNEKGKKFIISKNLGTIENEISPQKFYRINRSQIINIDFIYSIDKYFNNRLAISIKGYDEKVLTSSAITSKFRKWLEE